MGNWIGQKREKQRGSRVALFLILLLLLMVFTVGCGQKTDDSTSPKGNTPYESEQDSSEKNADGSDVIKPEQNQEFLVLINKTNPVDETYVPEDLTSIKYFAADRSKEGRFMRAEAAVQFETLVEAAAKEGYELVMTTAYRSYGFQNTLYTNYVNRYGEDEANTFSAKPGRSEHQSGLAVDVSSPVVDYALSDDFGKTAEGAWMAEHAHEYGFILRFPLGKEEITGYQYEPWHLRYVGQPAADRIYEKGITLEEYLER